MASKKIPIEIDLSTSSAQQNVKALNKELAATEKDLEEAGTAGQRMAESINRATDKAIAEIDSTRAAVDALEKALGPDFKGDTRDVVANLKAVGLTADEVTRDADELAAAIKRTDDVKLHAAKQGFDSVDQAVTRVGTSTDASRGALANFASNAVTELPGVAGAFGPVAQGVGELTERLAEGELGMRNFILAAGGMAVAGFAVKGIADHYKEIAAAKAFRKDQIDDYVDALEDADSVLDAIVAKLSDQGGIFVDLFGDGGPEEFTEAVRNSGLGVQQFAELVERGNPAIDEWAEAMRGAGHGGDDLDITVLALKREVDSLTGAQDAAKLSAEFLTTANAKQSEGLSKVGDATEATTAKIDTNVAAMERQRLKTEELTEANRILVGGELAVESSYQRAGEAVTKLAEMQDSGKASASELAAQTTSTKESVLAAAEAAAQYEADQRRANGEVVTAQEENEILAGKLDGFVNFLEGDVRVSVQGYAADLRNIPSEINTRIKITQITSGGNQSNVGDAKDHHVGGRVAPGDFIQPLSGEAFVADRPGWVRTEAQTDRIQRGGGDSFSVTVNNVGGAPVTPHDISRAIQLARMKRR